MDGPNVKALAICRKPNGKNDLDKDVIYARATLSAVDVAVIDKVTLSSVDGRDCVIVRLSACIGIVVVGRQAFWCSFLSWLVWNEVIITSILAAM